MEKFGDPEFVTHATAARLYTLIAMRAAGAEVVPLKFTTYGEALREYVDDLRRMVARKARAVESDNEPARRSSSKVCPGWSPPIKGFEALATARSTRRPTPWRSGDGVALRPNWPGSTTP